jgi:4'-phosphopantetheinyl transferase
MGAMTDPEHVVDVRWHQGLDADAALRAHVAVVVGTRADAVSVGRLCPRCASDDHGRPWSDHGVQVSLARAGPHVVTAVATVAVGIDAQSVASLASAARGLWDDRGIWDDLGLGLEGSSPAERAALWCRLEAVAKLTGDGLSRAFDGQSLDPYEGAYDGVYDVRDLAAPEGFAAAVAVHRRADAAESTPPPRAGPPELG